MAKRSGIEQRLQVIEALAAEARPLILRYWRPDSCIASSRIGQLVLAHFGIRSQPLAVRVLIFNGPLWRRLARGDRPERGQVEQLYQEDGSWSVGLGFPSGRPEGWPGHLILISSAPKLLIDLSLDQASRPKRGIELRPLLRATTAPFLRGEEELPVQMGTTALAYQAMPGERSYLSSPDWQDTGRHQRILPELIRRIEGRVGAS